MSTWSPRWAVCLWLWGAACAASHAETAPGPVTTSAMPEGISPAPVGLPSDAPDSAHASEQNALMSGGEVAPAANAPLPLYGALVVQRVKDFAAWKASFDAELDARKHAGFAAQGILRGVDSDKLVGVWLAVTDASQAKAFFADKAWRERLRAAGVPSRPEVYLWSNLEAKMDPGKQGLVAAMLIARVRDVAVFKAAFAEAEPVRNAAGVVGYGLSQDIDDKSVVYIYLQSEDSSKLSAYVEARQTKQALRDAGMRSPPTVIYLREGELTTYH